MGLEQILYREDGTKRPVMTGFLVGCNVLVWCILELFGDTLDGAYIAAHGGSNGLYILRDKEWWRLFTSMFLHFGPYHLANNMIFLAAAGEKLEQAAGSIRFLVIYLASGLAGNLLSFYMEIKEKDYVVGAGASGAVFGVIGALVWVAVKNRGRFEGMTVKGLLFLLALCLYNGLRATGIDNWAHAGGAAAGFILAVLLVHRRVDDSETVS